MKSRHTLWDKHAYNQIKFAEIKPVIVKRQKGATIWVLLFILDKLFKIFFNIYLYNFTTYTQSWIILRRKATRPNWEIVQTFKFYSYGWK